MEYFKSFDELFENAIRYGSIEQPKNTAHKEAIRSFYNFSFNDWLSQNKGWRIGNTKEYRKHLTKSNWLEFVQQENTLKSKFKVEFEQEKKSWQTSNVETKKDPETLDVKPVFKPDVVQNVYDILKDYFSKEQHEELRKLLESGNDSNKHLIFLDNGNRLADAFKQLIKAGIITGCEQKELESWIGNNFKYRYRHAIKEYTSRYLNDIISTNKDRCQKPILNVTVERATGEIKIKKA